MEREHLSSPADEKYFINMKKEIFAGHMSNKIHVSRKYEELSKPNNKKKTIQLENGHVTFIEQDFFFKKETLHE